MVLMESNLQASGATSLNGKDSLSGFLFLPLCMLVMLILVTGVAFTIERWYKTEIRQKLADKQKELDAETRMHDSIIQT